MVFATGTIPKPQNSQDMSGASDLSKQSGNQPLHFVNTDADTIGTKGAGRRTRDVKSHLSGHYRRWKKQQALSLQAAQNQHQSADDSNISSPTSRDSVDATRILSTVPLADDSDCPSDEEEKDSAEERRLNNVDRRQSQLTTLQNTISHGNSDPFRTTPLLVDPKTNMYLQLFYAGSTVVCWSTRPDQLLRDLVQHEALMHGVLAISKIISATYLPGHSTPAAPLPECRHHYGELLRLMRAYFADRETVDPDLAIEMMHAAMMFSFLAREYDEFEVHLKSMKALIDSIGGLKAVSHLHSSRFLSAECLRGLFLLRTPLIPLQEWAPGSWSEEAQFRQYDHLHEKGLTMVSLANPPLVPRGIFAERARDLVMDHRDMLAAGSVATMLSKSRHHAAENITRWLDFRSHALTIETTETVGEIVNMAQNTPSIEFSLHASTCLAANFTQHLIHFSTTPIMGISYAPFPTLTKHLREVARHVRNGAQLQYHDLYMWALFVGACAELASRTWSCDPSCHGSSWCSTKFAYMIEKLGIDTVEELKVHLRQFLFPYLFEPYLRVLFDKRHELIKLSIADAEI